jgi:hypothetical protein
MEPNKANEPSTEDELPVLPKPYTAEKLALTIRATLDAGIKKG